MPRATSLTNLAIQIAAGITAEANDLRSKIAELKRQLADLECELASAIDANSRASSFHTTATVKGYDHCPNCWVKHHSKSPLILVNRDDEEEKNPNEDILTCHICKTDFATDESGQWWVR